MPHWVRFRAADGQVAFGVLEGDRIRQHEGDFFERPTATGVTVSSADVALLPPCTPTKIIALWNNFHELAAKLQKTLPAHPLFLIKPASSLAGPGDPIRRPANYHGKIAYEGELGIVIGRHCSNVPASNAAQYIHGYTCVNDVTAAEVLTEDPNFPQWCRAKGYDTFACVGPVIASDFVPASARVVVTMDGVERQNYPLADMVFSPVELVSLLSQDMSLHPGDVIACGTSIGVGSIKDGATVAVTIDGIGTLVNRLAS